ncbi:hypothetical protein ACJX0J_007711, partial [Zea mays]
MHSVLTARQLKAGGHVSEEQEEDNEEEIILEGLLLELPETWNDASFALDIGSTSVSTPLLILVFRAHEVNSFDCSRYLLEIARRDIKSLYADEHISFIDNETFCLQ